MEAGYPWAHAKRYNSYPEYFRQLFGGRVQKVAVDAGFTCPNRDGTRGTGGCTFCLNDAFNPSYCDPAKSISRQIAEGITFHHTRYRRAIRYLAYFQAFSNTYASLEKLKEMYSEALSLPEIAGLVIGTRPDCVNDEILDYLARLSETWYIKIEYGIESVHNETLQHINRGHTFEESILALEKTRDRGIPAGGHFIIGLPGESIKGFISDVPVISALPLKTIKFHQLQIIEGTRMAQEYRESPGKFVFQQLDEYLELMASIAERLNPALVLERIAAEVPPRFLAGPGWGLIRYDEVLRKFEQVMEERDTWQGRLYGGE